MANHTDFEADKSIMEIDFRQLREDETPPYHLLELADPSRKVIDTYLPDSEIYLGEYNGRIIAEYVLYPIDSNNIIEIKNIAVLPEFQGKGFGKKINLSRKFRKTDFLPARYLSILFLHFQAKSWRVQD